MYISNLFKAASLIVICLFFVVACSGSSTEEVVIEPSLAKTNVENINELWSTTVTPLLSQDLWTDRDKYDAAHILMQPMHYAFLNQDSAKIKEFDEFFNQLDLFFDNAISDNRVSDTQFMYFVSEYLVLKQSTGSVNGSTLSVYSKLEAWLVNFMNSPAWLWARPPFDTVPQRMTWKLNTKDVDFSYYRAVFDEDLHSYAALANLAFLANSGFFTTSSQEFSDLVVLTTPQIKQILEQEIVLQQEVDAKGNRAWLFQPGVWWQHPEYSYAGNAQLAQGLAIMQVDGIATDSSHMHRWPLWLKAFKRAFFSEPNTQDYISGLELGLALQFNDKVYVPAVQGVATPRMTNFFDGHNGVYRYNFSTTQNSGYGPYQLSGSLYIGWYGSLDSAEQFQADIEALLKNGYSLSDSELAVLVGPNTTRERNPLFVWPDYFTNGMAELNLRVTLALLNRP